MLGTGRGMLRAASATLIGLAIASLADAAEISGAGATFPYPIYVKWAEAYQAATGVSLNYQSIGSGGGINQLEAKAVDFGASDMPLKPEDLAKHGLTQFPAVMGGEVMLVNVPGVAKGEMTLDGPTIANIYLGRVTQWGDPAIARLNPGLKLPADLGITVIHRADGSGTTFNFTDYLAKVSPEWKQRVGEGASVDWPVAGLGGKGNEGVSALAARKLGSIAYVEYAYAVQNDIVYTKLMNRAGKALTPGAETFEAAAQSADWKNAPGFYLLLTDQQGDNSWPITAASFILMQTRQEKPENAKAALDFFAWSFKNGARLAASLDYVAFPSSVVALIEANWQQNIKDMSGKPVWNGPGS